MVIALDPPDQQILEDGRLQGGVVVKEGVEGWGLVGDEQGLMQELEDWSGICLVEFLQQAF